ncbi:hypothetical protein CPA58_29545, partial [Klebsiella pneumoniae]
GLPSRLLVPAPTLDEMREARRQNRHTRPALTKLEAMGKKHLIGLPSRLLVPAPTLDEMREARRQNRHTRPALTK